MNNLDWQNDPFNILRYGFEKDNNDKEQRKQKQRLFQIVSGAGVHVEKSHNDEFIISRLDT